MADHADAATVPDAGSVESAIRGAGLRVTSARSAVLSALREHPHASADAIFADVEALAPGTTRQSVYNVLGDFAASGLVRRIQPAGQPMRFEVRIDDNHHHLVCTRCGRVEDVDCVVGDAPCLHPSQTHGFSLTQAEVTFWGLCASCADASSASASSTPSTHPPTVTEGSS